MSGVKDEILDVNDSEGMRQTDFLAMGTVYQRIGLNADLQEINWNYVYRTEATSKCQKIKHRERGKIEANLYKLKEYSSRKKGVLSAVELRVARSIWRQNKAALNDLDEQIEWLEEIIGPLSKKGE